MGEVVFKAYCEDIRSVIGAKQLILDHLRHYLADADKIEDEEDATVEWEVIEPVIKKVEKVITALEKLLVNITRD